MRNFLWLVAIGLAFIFVVGLFGLLFGVETPPPATVSRPKVVQPKVEPVVASVPVVVEPEAVPVPVKEAPQPQKPQLPPAKAATPPLTTEETTYVGLAHLYLGEVVTQGDNPSVLKGTIGHLPGAWTIDQVPGRGVLLMSRGDATIIVRNVMGQAVDGMTVSMADDYFIQAEPVSYTTIIGAVRTVRAFDRLDGRMMRWALDHIQQEGRSAEDARRAERQQKIDAARDWVSLLESEYAAFKQERQAISDYLDVADQLRLYESSRAAGSATKAVALRHQLEDMQKPTDAEVEDYHQQSARFQEEIRNARRSFLELRE
jgi:hypothetical protein